MIWTVVKCALYPFVFGRSPFLYSSPLCYYSLLWLFIPSFLLSSKVKMYVTFITLVSFGIVQCFVFSVNWVPGSVSLKVLKECYLCVLLDEKNRTEHTISYLLRWCIPKRIRSVKTGVKQNHFPVTYFLSKKSF